MCYYDTKNRTSPKQLRTFVNIGNCVKIAHGYTKLYYCRKYHVKKQTGHRPNSREHLLT